jgi:hypothetical protein
MAKFDWDRETREARKRAHGSLPLWADPGALSFDDDRHVRAVLEPMVSLIDEYAELSSTQRRQREGEFKFRIVRAKRDALSEGGRFPNSSARENLSRRAEMLIERFREQSRDALGP